MTPVNPSINLLVIEDKPADFRLVVRHLEQHGLAARCHRVASIEELEAAVEQGGWDAVLSDYSVPKMDFQHTLGFLQAVQPDLPVILVSGSVGEERAVELLKLGVWDFVLKDSLARLVPAIERNMREAANRHAKRVNETALRQSEDEFRTMFELASIGMAQAHPRTGQWLRVNQKMCAITGYTADEMLRMHISDITNPEDREVEAEAFERVVSGEAADYHMEKRLLRKDGAVAWVNVNMTVIRDASGQPTRTMATIEDITERRRSDEVIAGVRERLSLATRAAHMGIWDWDVVKNQLVWDEGMYTLYGVREEDFGGAYEAWLAGIHPEDRARTDAESRQALASSDEYRSEFRVAWPDGTVRQVRAQGTVFRGDAGQPLRMIGVNYDITDAKRAEGLAREKDRSDALHEAIASLPIGVLVTELDPDGTPRIVTYNSAYSRIVGSNPRSGERHEDLPEGIFLADRVTRLAPPDWAGARAARTGEAVHGAELNLRRGDGEWRVLQMSAAPVPGGELGARRSVTVLLDVTERKQAEDALRSARDYLGNLIGYANAPIIVWDPGRKITLFNHAFERMTGYSAAEVIGKDLELLFPERSRGESIAQIAGTVEGRRWESVEIPIQCKSGEIRVALWNSANVHGPDGVVLQATIAQGQDITERKRAEAERERLGMAIDQAAETVVVTDAAGTILYVNPAFHRTTGYTAEEAVGQNPRILKSGKQDPAIYRELWETLAAGKTWSGRLVNRKKSGEFFTEEATISPVREATGAIVSYVAVKRDITRDLELMDQLLQSQKMESIGRLAGGVAHDFNNILSVILSCAGFALEELREGDPLREEILEIEKGGKRAAALTRQLLAFSRKQLLQPVSLDLNRSLAEMEKMLRRIIGEDVELVQVLAPDLGLTRADSGQVEQVVMNLAVNARDAMPTGGKLTIETSNVTLDEEYAARHAGAKPGSHVMVAVTDSGVGMDERTLARIFEPFFTTKAVGNGTGLGLSTVYGIVQQSGGSIFVHSEIGRGTTFRIFLPREQGLATEVASASRATTGAARGETILVVEDDDSLRRITKRTLERAGYHVLTAANGGEGLLTCEQHAGHIHLVLTDVVMPQMNGREFVERLAKVRPGMKVLFMSGYTDETIVHHGVLNPGTQFIGKPFMQADLLARVRGVLDGDGQEV
jgi:two-component system cell cycle sensor histidine kinase/response regulator CckA